MNKTKTTDAVNTSTIVNEALPQSDHLFNMLGTRSQPLRITCVAFPAIHSQTWVVLKLKAGPTLELLLNRVSQSIPVFDSCESITELSDNFPQPKLCKYFRFEQFNVNIQENVAASIAKT